MSGRKKKTSENGRFHEILTTIFVKTLHQDSHFSQWGEERFGRELGMLIFEFRNGICQPYLISCVKKWLRENIFTPYKLLCEMDKAGGMQYADF